LLICSERKVLLADKPSEQGIRLWSQRVPFAFPFFFAPRMVSRRGPNKVEVILKYLKMTGIRKLCRMSDFLL
jgi:hypothetical protein